MDISLHKVTSKVAFICGVTGQDGAYLAAHLLGKGYIVHGSTRVLPLPSQNNLARLGIAERVRLVQLDPTCLDSVRVQLAATAPHEVYNLAGQSSVGMSFLQPYETWKSIEIIVVNWLEAIRCDAPATRFFNAGSAECYGKVDGPIDELTAFGPMSPYAAAKSAAHWQVSVYRQSFGLHVGTGVLFNHESPLREAHFVTGKIVDGARRIACGDKQVLHLGNLDVWRDWGWAPDYVDAMWRMLQSPSASDYVIATGKCVSLQYFVELSFAHFGLDWRQHVVSDAAFMRPTDIVRIEANPSKIRRDLGWQATHSVEQVVALMAKST